MPGFELIGTEELESLKNIFSESNGVLFAHGFDARRNGRFRVRELERAFSKKLGSQHCQAVTSGTAAGAVALKALGVGPGDEVITQSFTFVATVESIIACGATPIVVDVDKSLNMCPMALEKAITPKTKCILPVHMLGNPARMDKIMAIANKHNIPVVEDACEAMGASFQGQLLGTIGKLGFFSLDFGKVITCGEGGLVITNDKECYLSMAAFHDHGHENNPQFSRGRDTASAPGFNYRMTEMQGAVALAQLAKLDFILEKNKQNKSILREKLSSLGDRIEFREITDHKGELADTLMFFLPTKEITAKIVSDLAQQGVGTKNVPDAMEWHFSAAWGRIWKDHPIYKNDYQTRWSNSSALLERCISLPVMVLSKPEDINATADKIIATVRKYT